MIDRRTMIGILVAAIPTAACSRPAKAPPTIQVYKSPSCGCCGAWVKRLQANGFLVTTQEMEDVSAIAASAGVPDRLRSCHTALVDGYFVEGHVPDGDIRKLLSEWPNARGIAVPGMPVGSPGMEQDGRREPYDTLLVMRDGSSRPFVRHNQRVGGK
ncbi:DUF411 domain-containing protein [Sphingomonas sabuli]|uniref:DUF411 domain-containing protein n=2 Tax=Sphingomonas sabuli TaxID=2764186 RepID=A0A7G9L5R8_9SPHN|nr:DUF411 domain-containing protein [Sphingomonas sabuli]